MRLPRTFASSSMHDWCIELGLRDPRRTFSHVLLDHILSDPMAPAQDISWLRLNWLPFLDSADGTLARMTREWGGLDDDRFPEDRGQLSAQCQELAKLHARYVAFVVEQNLSDKEKYKVGTSIRRTVQSLVSGLSLSTTSTRENYLLMPCHH